MENRHQFDSLDMADLRDAYTRIHNATQAMQVLEDVLLNPMQMARWHRRDLERLLRSLEGRLEGLPLPVRPHRPVGH